MNALHLFFQDFKEKGVSIDAEDCDVFIDIDYDSVQVALYHVLENAAKYTMPNTPFRITFPYVNDRQHVLFDMISAQITDVDIERMFDEGYSGQLPHQLQQAGAGIGMGVARDLLALNEATIEVRRNVDPTKKSQAMIGTFENNQIDLAFGPAV